MKTTKKSLKYEKNKINGLKGLPDVTSYSQTAI